MVSLFAMSVVAWAAEEDDPLPHPVQQAFYISPSGSDATGNGTIHSPFRTLEKARDTVGTWLASHTMTGEAVVYLRGGTYELSQTFELDDRDSGNSGFQVVYKAYSGERVILSGGTEITGWESVDAAHTVYKANIGNLEFRQVYVNDRRAVRARTPNAGEFFRVKAWDEANKLIKVDADDAANVIPSVTPDSNVEIVVQTHWSDQHLKVESITADGPLAAVATRAQERNLLFVRKAPTRDPGASYHFENAKAFMDTNGEFYLDAANDLLYYMPRFGEDMERAKVIVPRLEPLLKVQGTLDQPASGIRFEGLNFEHNGWKDSPILNAGESLTLHPVLLNADARPVTWEAPQWQFESANPAAATVSASGAVYAVQGPQQTTIAVQGLYKGAACATNIELFTFSPGATLPLAVNTAKGNQRFPAPCTLAATVRKERWTGL